MSLRFFLPRSSSDNDVTKMEGCPRSLMLNVDLKEPFPTEFTPSLKAYIREHYNEDADSYNNECSQLEQLRTASIHPSRDHSGCSTLRRYYAQLQFLQSRFPMGDGGAVNIQFTWTDLYSEEPISLCDIKFEQASVLHNLASLHSQLGSNEDRTTEEGMKVACTHFQSAAGIFQYLKAGSFCKVEHFIDHFASDAFFDMAGGLLQLYTNVMLGQAQECLLEKSILDSRKDSLVARISMQVYEYYNQALQFLDSQGPSYMGSRKAKLWTKSLKIKCCQHLAVAYIYMSNNADENQKFGEKVAYLKAASQKITEAQKASKGQPERTLELLQFLADVVSNKLQGAVKDNDFIYHEVVPELDSLPEIKAAPLVKPIPFQPCDSSVSGPDIFQRLIPMGAHTDSSLYSEEKAKLLRRYVGSIEQKNQLLGKALSDLHIDDLLEPEGYDTLPAGIIQKRNSLINDGSLKEVESNVEELKKVGTRVEEMLASLTTILEEDKKREKQIQGLVPSFTPPPEREEFEKDLEQCRESHKKAMQTNTELVKVFQEHKHNLDLLVGPSEGLLAALPSLNIIDTPIDDGAVQRLRDLISKVELMKSQRKQLEADLRKQLEEDDITQLLVTREGNKTLFFEEQLKKHDATCDLIQKNLDAQSKILKALTEANAKYAPTRQAVKETAQRRDDAVQTFVLSHDTFFELKEKLSRGLRFYQSLEKTVLKLEEKLKEFAEKRKKEMDKIEEKEKRIKEKARVPPARPGAEKPSHLINPPGSSVPRPMATQYPGGHPGGHSGGPGIPHPGMRPGTFPPTSHGVPFQPRIPGAAFPPRSFPGANSPRPADPRVYQPGSQGVSPRLPVPSGEQRMLAPNPGVPLQHQQNFPEQRVPQTPTSPATGAPIRPTIPSQPGVPFSQMGPRGPAPAEHLIHSTPRMSYPVPVTPSFPPGGAQGVQAGGPGGPYHVPHPSGQQPRPQLAPGQVPGPGSTPGLPSYDLAKRMPGTQPSIQQPPPQNWPQGQYPATSQQQAGGHPSGITPQQQFQAPRGPYPTSQPPHISPAGPPQLFPQQIPTSQMSQPLQPATSQYQPKNWPTQPFHFPKLAQQPIQPQQQFQQIQQPYQRQQQPPHQLQLQPQSLHPQQQTSVNPQQQQPGRPPPQQQHPLHPTQQQLPHPQQQFQQPQFPPPLQPQNVPQPPSHMQQQFQHRPPSQPQQKPQQPPYFQQQPHPSQPPQQLQQSMQQFQQPVQMNPQFNQPQQQMQHSREPLKPTQVSQAKQQQQQQFQPPLQPQLSYQQQLQPMQPQKTQQQPYKPPLQPQPLPMQKPPLDHQIPTDRLPQQAFQPGKTPPQNAQTSLAPQMPQQISQVPELPPKGRSQMSQMPGSTSWPQQSSNLPSQPSLMGYLSQKSYAGYSQSQQPSQSSSASSPLGYPMLPEKKRSQADPPSSKPPQEGFSSQHPGSLQPGPPSSLQSWGYPQASQPLSSTGASHGSQLSRQDSKEPLRLGGNQMISPKKSLPYEQRPVDQGWAPSPGVQRPPPQNQAAYSSVIAGQNSADYGKDSQYQGQTRGRIGSYPPYTGIVTKPPSSPAAGNPPYSYSAMSVTLPLVQGVRPSPTSLPPSSAYATSYSVSVAQAQLNQQQQMQQLQTQMLLQQQQLILQQQELLHQQQQQQHHESDQGHLTQLFQQMLQQQTKLAEMEQKLAEHKRHEEDLKKELTKTEREELPPVEKGTEAADNESQATTPQSSSSFSASWSSGFSDRTHNKLNIEQVFSDLAKKQISEISEKGKHADGVSDSSKPDVETESDIDMSKKDSDTLEYSEKEIVGGKKTEVKSVSTDELTKGVDDHGTAEVINTEQGSVSLGEETNDKSNFSSSTEHKTENYEVDSPSSAEDKPDGESRKRENTSDEDKEKQRRQQIEEQILQIKKLQKNTQPAPPPLPQKKKYLYEPGKMPETCELPLIPPDTVTAEEPNKPSLYRQCGHYYDTQHSRIGQAENNDCLSEEEFIQRLSFTVETFDALVVSLSQKKEGTPHNGFIHEWKALEKMQESDSCVFSTKDASLNPSKNRYRDVLPWDHTRVKLTTKEGGDYINANLIKKVTDMSPDYILTQGPIAATLEDFWLLVWEQKSPVIVMLTKEVEGNRLKCHQYWPIDEGHTVVYGNIRVHMRSKKHSEAWIERIMHVQHSESDEVLVVSHLQFTGWPDHGVPHSPSDLLTYLSEVHNHHYTRDPQAERPLVVHCSAGVGRAGTFCVIYTAIRELNGTGNIVNIPKLVRIFRQHRKFTVQKKEQYEFCYRAVLFYANQYLQLEKTAVAFKKSKLASQDHLGDVSSASPVTSLSDSGQRKADDMSFLGEISSDEDSSDSSSEFDEEKSSLVRRRTSQDLEDFDQIKTTDLEISGRNDSSQVTSDSSRDAKSIPCTSTISADLPAAGESSGSVSEKKVSSVADTPEFPKATTDLSAAIEETKGSKVEELADRDVELKDASVDSSYAKKESEKASSSSTINAELTVMSERGLESVEARESVEEPNSCSGGEKGCNDEVVEEDVSEKQVVSRDTGEESTDTALEVEGNAKEEGDQIGGKENEREQTNTDQSMSVTQTNEQTESLDEKNSTTGLLKTEVNGQQGQENQEQSDNPQENDKQGEEGSKQQGQENVEKVNREPCNSHEGETNNEQTEERKAEDYSESSGDGRRTEFKKKSESESLEQTKQDCEYQQTNGV